MIAKCCFELITDGDIKFAMELFYESECGQRVKVVFGANKSYISPHLSSSSIATVSSLLQSTPFLFTTSTLDELFYPLREDILSILCAALW